MSITARGRTLPMPSALVLAGNSFIGRHLGQAFRTAGARVVETARGETVPSGAQPCDLTDRGRVEEVVAAAQPDWIVQCAGATQTNDPWLLDRLHVQGT